MLTADINLHKHVMFEWRENEREWGLQAKPLLYQYYAHYIYPTLTYIFKETEY
jgi:hypothetical protein